MALTDANSSQEQFFCCKQGSVPSVVLLQTGWRAETDYLEKKSKHLK